MLRYLELHIFDETGKLVVPFSRSLFQPVQAPFYCLARNFQVDPYERFLSDLRTGTPHLYQIVR